MIRLEFPKINLDSYSTDGEKIEAMKRYLDNLTTNLMVTLDSIEADIEDYYEHRKETQ